MYGKSKYLSISVIFGPEIVLVFSFGGSNIYPDILAGFRIIDCHA